MDFFKNILRLSFARLNTRDLKKEVHGKVINAQNNEEAFKKLNNLMEKGNPERDKAINDIVDNRSEGYRMTPQELKRLEREILEKEHEMIKSQMPQKAKPNVKAYVVKYFGYYQSPNVDVSVVIICKDETEISKAIESMLGFGAPRLEIKTWEEIDLAKVKIKDLDAQSFYNLMKA